MRSLALLVAVLALAATATTAQARVPHSFFGSVADGALFEQAGVLESELDAMVGAGVGSVRIVFDWRWAQRYGTFADVPEAERELFRDEEGVPTDWSEIDRYVGELASRRIRVLPVVIQAPDWAARHPGGNLASPPRDPDQYARFMAALARRYGPGGAFWAERPELPARPIRDWQVWNEPNAAFFWSDHPSAGDYTELLEVSDRALKQVDPRSRTVLGGIVNRSWAYLARLYRAGAGPSFDVAAFHPFTGPVAGVVEILRRNRRVMRRHGNPRKPLQVTELSWTSALGKTEHSYGWETTINGQAARVRKVLPLLARKRRSLRLQRVYWYTWLTRDSHPEYPFDYAGLNRLGSEGVERKPAFRSFRRTALRLVGCRAKSGRADRCGR